MVHGRSTPRTSSRREPIIALEPSVTGTVPTMSNRSNAGPVEFRRSRSTPLATNDDPPQPVNTNTSGLTPVMFSTDSSAVTMSISTWLEKMVGAEAELMM